MLDFSCDYLEGMHPEILKRLASENLNKHPGYGLDNITAKASERIRKACNAPDLDVYFLAGGTQTNATVISALLESWQGVISAASGHISVHEAGAIEYGGHKVLNIPSEDGKIKASELSRYLQKEASDGNRDHMVHSGLVYISQPTEYGTLYSKAELQDISTVCRKAGLPLYMDGARLLYAKNDLNLADIAELCDVFYIGGTKAGTLYGEAVIGHKGKLDHFFTIMKQHGALLAKTWAVSLQFDVLFSDGLYQSIGDSAVSKADRIRKALDELGYEQAIESPTNQIFIKLENSIYEQLSKQVGMSFWEEPDESHTTVRIATSWATTDEDVDSLINVLAKQ
jgi:threonine aldolase